MTKIKSLTELGEIYANNVDRTSITESRRDQNEILLTDAKAYLPTGSAPKTGEGFGKKQEELAKKTGPEEAEGFEKVDKKQDPGSDKAEMAAKQTTPKEKIQEEVETAPKTTKYKKPTFTMSKSKFDQIYEVSAVGEGSFSYLLSLSWFSFSCPWYCCFWHSNGIGWIRCRTCNKSKS